MYIYSVVYLYIRPDIADVDPFGTIPSSFRRHISPRYGLGDFMATAWKTSICTRSNSPQKTHHFGSHQVPEMAKISPASLRNQD